MKGVSLFHVGHPLILFKINHKTSLHMCMRIGYLEPLIFIYGNNVVSL